MFIHLKSSIGQATLVVQLVGVAANDPGLACHDAAKASWDSNIELNGLAGLPCFSVGPSNESFQCSAFVDLFHQTSYHHGSDILCMREVET